MGYSTDFTGELLFTNELSVREIAMLKCFFEECCSDHTEWEGAAGLGYVDLEFNDDFTGIRWNGAEKTYDLEKIVNVVIINFRKQAPNFGLKGTLIAQGEEASDKWQLVIDEDDGLAKRIAIQVVGKKITCPCCGKDFFLEGDQ